jgi:hypothetical protein
MPWAFSPKHFLPPKNENVSNLWKTFAEKSGTPVGFTSNDRNPMTVSTLQGEWATTRGVIPWRSFARNDYPIGGGLVVLCSRDRTFWVRARDIASSSSRHFRRSGRTGATRFRQFRHSTARHAGSAGKATDRGYRPSARYCPCGEDSFCRSGLPERSEE